MIQENEKKRLAKLAENNKYGHGVNKTAIEYAYKIYKNFFRTGSVLEVGPGEGIGTEIIYDNFMDYTIIDGSSDFCKRLKLQFPNIITINNLFEEFNTEKKFDNIILGHVLEHVIDPVSIIKRYKGFLTKNGRIFANVPNAFSIHRQAAVLMGLLIDEHQINETDIQHGHRRVYDPYSFRNDFLKAEMTIEFFGGFWLKPLSNKQIEDNWTAEMLQSFMILGEKYVDIAAEIYIIGKQ